MIKLNNMKALFTFIGEMAGLIILGIVAYEELQAAWA